MLKDDVVILPSSAKIWQNDERFKYIYIFRRVSGVSPCHLLTDRFIGSLTHQNSSLLISCHMRTTFLLVDVILIAEEQFQNMMQSIKT